MSRNLEPLSNSHFKFHFRQAAGQLPPSEKDPPLAPALLAGGTEPPARLSYRITISGNCNAVCRRARQCILQLAFVLFHSYSPSPMLCSSVQGSVSENGRRDNSTYAP